MNKGSTRFLKLVITLVAIGSLAILVRFPQTEGRAANLELIQIYTDPLIIYTYLAAIPFFVALRQGYKILDYVEANKTFSSPTVRAVENIRRCGILIATMIVGSELYLILVERPKADDIAGGVMMGLILLVVALVTVTAATILQKLLLHAVDLKSESDLTV